MKLTTVKDLKNDQVYLFYRQFSGASRIVCLLTLGDGVPMGPPHPSICVTIINYRSVEANGLTRRLDERDGKGFMKNTNVNVDTECYNDAYYELDEEEAALTILEFL